MNSLKGLKMFAIKYSLYLKIKFILLFYEFIMHSIYVMAITNIQTAIRCKRVSGYLDPLNLDPTVCHI